MTAPVGLNLDEVIAFTDFVQKRHMVWEARQADTPPPWTDDPILATHKFTNVFRVLDYGSQFLLKELVDPDISPRDQLMRCFLYRHTGRWEAWEFYALMEGGYPTVADLDRVQRAFHAYRGQAKTTIRGAEARNAAGGVKNVFQRSIFTGAYLVFPQSTQPGTDKLDSIIDLTRRLFEPGGSQDVVPDFLAAKAQAWRFNALRRNKGVADFMSMQVLTDWGYTPHCGEDREDEFVVCGPGAKKGAAVLSAKDKPEDIARWAQGAISTCLVYLPDGRTRLPSLMDAQNTLCEFSKYARFRKEAKLPQPYRASHPGPQQITLPAHW